MDIVCSNGVTSIAYQFGSIVRKPVTQVTIGFGSTSINVDGKWDTGASLSCISLSTVARLGLISTGRILINTANGNSTTDLYMIDLSICKDISFNQLVACSGDIDGQGIGILIGMDVISRGDFLLENNSGQTKLYFRINNP